MSNHSNKSQRDDPGEKDPWWKNHQSSSGPLTPLTPISFAFLATVQSNSLTFSDNHDGSTSNAKSSDTLKSPSKELQSISGKLHVLKKEIIDQESPSSGDHFEPKAHLGWASFGESLKQEEKTSDESAPPKRKILVVRSKTPKTQTEVPPVENTTFTAPLALKTEPIEADSERPVIDVESDDDEIVDVVGIDEDEAKKTFCPPDLPPQRPLNTRFEAHRLKKDLTSRRGYDSDEEDLLRKKVARTISPPPRLERENNNESPTPSPDVAEKETDKEVETTSDDLEKRLLFCKQLDPTQMLKTKISTSAFPILPMSKSIMERKKAAIEMTTQAVIKRVPAPKNNSKSVSVAPKSVRVPAYSEKTSITLYSKIQKPTPPPCPKESRDCTRCRDIPVIDMSNFKFHDDASIISVRAHMCDQTRVMIARAALFNREYAKRLGDSAAGTMWQRPDEVTAQMTGFCSATVRRCIEIANLAIMPKCADRVGVSKAGLQTLQTAFGDEKFCGHTMKAPALLNTYYPMSGRPSSSERHPFTKKITTKSWEEKNAELMKMEEARKHNPLVAGTQPSTPSAPSTPDPFKKPQIRWSSMSSPRILRHPSSRASFPIPKTAVVPVMRVEKTKEEKEKPTVAIAPTLRKRGRPRKEKPEEGEKAPVRPYTRRLRSNKKAEAALEADVRGVVDALVQNVSGCF